MPDTPSKTWHVDASGPGFLETRTAEYDENGQMVHLTIAVTDGAGAVSFEEWMRAPDGSVMHTGALSYPDGRTTIIIFPGAGTQLGITHSTADNEMDYTKTWTYADDGSAVAEVVTNFHGTVSGTSVVRSTLLSNGALSGDAWWRSELTDSRTGHRTIESTQMLANGVFEHRKSVFDGSGNLLDDTIETNLPEPLPATPPAREELPFVPTPPSLPHAGSGGGSVHDVKPTYRSSEGSGESGIVLDWWYDNGNGDPMYLGSTG